MTLEPGPAARDRLAPAEAALARQALAVLDGNWFGRGTRPSAELYPHQWSWDSACVAIGLARFDQARAETELRSLFAGQWADGLVPHIVFREGGRYFPGPDFWQVERSSAAPADLRTSGIVQPPLHAIALRRLYDVAPDRERALALIRDLLDPLAAWHAYLHRERTRNGEPLVEIWHPWESGMDNSPSWDAALARVRPAPEEIPAYERVDVTVVDAAGRPSDAEYDRYAYLVARMRDAGYAPARIRAVTPFAMRSVLVNALLVEADRDLAELAALVGEEGSAFTERADRLSAGIDTVLWSEEHGAYLERDALTGTAGPAGSAASYAALFAGVPGPARAARLLERLEDAVVPIGDGVLALPSFEVGAPGFDAERYWRGPVWPMLTWLAYHGALRYGRSDLADGLQAALVELPRTGGFREHYHPLTGAGQGGDAFSWTAALALDVLAEAAAAEPRR